MDRRIVVAAMAAVFSFSAAGSLQAAPLSIFSHSGSTNTSTATTAKMVSFSVRNDYTNTLVLKAGDQQISIAPGKTVALKLAEGVDLTNISGTDKQPAGTVLTKVDRSLQGNTLAVS